MCAYVFSVLESTYQHDSLRYLLDYFIPAKHLLHKLQQHACSQYLGCLFLHSGWPLCLGEKVVVQLSTLDWRLLRSTDFYLQVVPFSTRCPRLALKCLAPGGRNVQEVLVPESQHPLVFTTEWLHSVNKERGYKREGGGGLDTCLVSTCDGVIRLPWEEVVYPKFIHNPSDDLTTMADHPTSVSDHTTDLTPVVGLGLGGWGGSSSGEPDSCSWDEEDDDLPPDSVDAEAVLPRRRCSEDGLGRTTRHHQMDGDGDYVELLEPRGGPDGGADPRQRYLEMHGICKTKTLPLCRRSKAIKLRRGKAWGYGRLDAAGGSRGVLGGKRDSVTPRGDWLPPRPLPRVIDLGRARRSESYPSSLQNSDEGEKQALGKDPEGLGSQGLYFDGPSKERRPGVGREREGSGCNVTQPCRGSQGSNSLVATETANPKAAHVVEGQSDQSSRSESVFEDVDKPLSGDRDTMPTTDTRGSGENAARTLIDIPGNGENVDSPLADGSETQKGRHSTSDSCVPDKTADSTEHRETERSLSRPGTDADPKGATTSEERDEGKTGEIGVCPRGKEVKTGGFRAPRRKRKGRGGKGKAKSGGRGNQKTRDQAGSKPPSKTPQRGPAISPTTNLPITTTNLSEATQQPEGTDKELTPVNEGQEKAEIGESNTGTVDRLGRAVVVTETHLPEDGCRADEMGRVLACYHRITRSSAKERGLTVIVDSRQSPPSALCLAALKQLQVHTVRGTGVLQQYIDRQQLPLEMDGDYKHCHSDWLAFRLSVESLTECCESALSLLEDALQSMDTAPLPDCIKTVPLSVEKHRQLMTSILVDQRLTELQRRGGAWLAGLANGTSGLAKRSPDCRAALAATSNLYDSVDDSLHRLVQVSNQRGSDLEALGRLAAMVDKLEKCEREIEQIQDQLEDYREPPISLSRLSLKQQKFKTFRESANELHTETLVVLGDLESWSELDWGGLIEVQANQWCDVISSTSPSPSPPLSSLPPIPPSRFQDARALALELGGGALLDLWSQTLERYQRTVAQVKPRLLQQAERGQNQGQARPKTPSTSSLWDLMGPEGEGDWGVGAGGGEGGLQSWGSLASLFRPQTCSTLKIGEEKGNKKEGTGGGGAGGGKFLQNLLYPAKKSPTEAPLPPKPPRKRHPSFDLQALLAPRRGPATARPVEPPVGAASQVSSKEVVDYTGTPRQHVLLSRAERETGGERQGTTTAQSKLYLLWCRMLSSERQYVAVLKGVEETYLPLLEGPDTPSSLRGKADLLFPKWASLSSFHSQNLLPAMEGALLQSLLQQDLFSKYREEFLQYSHYIRTKPELDSPLVTQAADFFKLRLPATPPLSPLSFPHCLQAPTLRLEQYCDALEELGGLNPASDSSLSVLRHVQRHGEDLRASDLIVGCPVPVAERGELVRQGELLVCGGTRRKKTGVRSVFLYQHLIIFTKQKSPGSGRTTYSFKHSIKTGEMGLTQSVGEEGVRFEVWVRQAPRIRDCLTLQCQSGEGRAAWTHDIAQLLWTHAIHNTELCLKETMCIGVSSKILLDVTGAPVTSELDSIYNLNDRVHSSCSDSSSVGSQKEGGSPASGRGKTQNQSPSTAV
ncbi:rho guanine nucleotide exchange factor 40 [Salvelinus namaycush]|uniref:Rho guanine nucleotide exchange factor 40 n=1 Tax=Salvelinus namaycush TaxID=8040 RepID=A0A8U0QXQ0_SALNM|nr:rho guanine nucleotide exchange factor 40 [Salvelinus namaycush]